MSNAIPVIINAKSGSGSGSGAGAGVDAVRQEFAARQLDAEVIVLGAGDDLAALIARALRQKPPVLVAGGGDGTVSAVAAHLVDGDTALGVLPLGTLNHFAKDLGIPLPLEDAVAVIAGGERITVDVGELGNTIFLNNSSLGLYPKIVNAREQAQQRLGIGKWPALTRATWHALRDPHTFTVNLRVDDQALQRRTPFLFVGNNRYTLRGFAAGSRERLDDGVLSLYVLRPQTPFGFTRLAWRTLRGRTLPDEDFEAFSANELKIDSARARVDVALDGEVVGMDTPLQYRLRPRALQVLVPRVDTNADDDDGAAAQAG